MKTRVSLFPRLNPDRLVRSISPGLIVAAMLACLSSSPAYTQTTLTWDANGAMAGSGGTGMWNTTTPLWVYGTTFVSWTNSNLDDAIFAGTAGTVTVSGAINVHNITFNIPGYTISGGTLTLGGTTPTITGGGTISSVLAGMSLLVNAGATPLTLSGTNTYSGGTTINSGTLQVGAGGTTGTLGTGVITNNAALVFNRSNTAILANAISGGGTITQAGTGTTTLTGTNTYTGTTTITVGTLQVGNTGTSGTLGTGAVVNNGGLAFSRSDTLTIANTISGSGTVTKAGTGTTILTGANSYSGGTTISNGTLRVDEGGTLGTGAVAMNSLGVLAFNPSTTLTIANAISGVNRPVTHSGTGTTILTGTNTYSGGTTISAGTLQVGDGGTTGTLGTGGVVNNAALVFNRSDTATVANVIAGTGTVTQAGTGTTSLAGANTYSGGTTISSGTLQVGIGGLTGALGTGPIANAAALVFIRSAPVVGAISGSGTVTQAGPVTTILLGDNTYTGTTTITAGTLFTQAGTGTTILTGANSYTGATTISAGTLQVGDGGTTGALGTGPIANAAALVFNRSDTLTMANAISGGGTVTQAGTGTTILTGTNTYTGATGVTNGTLVVNGSLGNTATTVASGATLRGTGTIAGAVTIGANGTIAPGTTTTVGMLTVGSLNLGSGSILNYRLDTPDVVGSGVNDLIVVTNDLLLDGTVNVTGLPGFGLGTYRVMNYGGALIDNGLTFGALPTGFAYGIQTSVPGQVNLIVLNPTTQTIQFWDGANMAGNGVVDGGSGILTAGPTNWTDSTGNINQGWGGQTAVFGGTAGTVTVVGPIGFTELRFESDGYSLVAGAGASLITSTADTVVRVTPGAVTMIGVPITGAGGIDLQGAGTLILTGENRYTGGTTIDAGTLQLGNCGPTGSIAGDVRNDGVLVFSHSDRFTFNGAISGTGAVVKNCTGTAILTATNSYTGGTLANAGILQGDVQVNSALVFDQSDNGTFTGMLFGPGTLTKIGPGTVLLTGPHGLSGMTSIDAGTLALDGSLAGAVRVQKGATFDATGAIGGALNVDGTLNVRRAASGGFGLLAVGGDVSLQNGSIFGIGLDAAGANSSVVTAGRASVNGATVAIAAQPGTYGRVTNYAVLQAERGLSGLATARSDTLTLSPYLSQSPNTLYVTLLRTDLPLQPYLVTANGWGFGGAIDRVKVGAQGDLAGVARELTALSDDALGHALDALSGEIHASATQMAAIDGESIMDSVRAEVATRVALRQEVAGQTPSPWSAAGHRVWFRYRNEDASFDDNTSTNGQGGRVGAHGGSGMLYGYTFGADWRFAQSWLAGVGGSYATGHLTLDGISERTDFTAPRALAYVAYGQTSWLVDAGFSVAHTAYDIARTFAFTAFGPTGAPLFGGLNRTATSDPSGWTKESWVEGRFNVPLASWTLSPTGALRFARYALDGWSESGADALSLTAPSQSIDSWQGDVGLRLERTVRHFRPFGGGRYRRELGSGQTSATVQIGGQPQGAFEVNSLPLAQNAWIWQGGLLVQWDRAGLSFTYEGRRSEYQTQHTVHLAIGFN